MRSVLRVGESAIVLVLIMAFGSLVMWVGVPLGWLWIASQIQGATNSVGVALAAALVGVVLSIGLVIALLTRLSNLHRSLRIARGHDDTGHLVLEVVIVTSAGITLVSFAVWFLLFAGSSPIPLNLSY
jgi:hypothetical protein